MEKAGYQVAEASDGKQAIAAYTRFQPDIVLLDTTMPLMDGFSCCTQLQILGGDRIPVLMLTTLEEAVERVFAAGASDYITKPIQWTVLHQRVRRLLQACPVTEELQQHEQQLKSVLESAAIGTWDWDMVSNKVVYSATTAVNFGLVPGSFDGTYQSLIASVHPEDRELAITVLHHAIEEKTDYNVEFRVIWLDGSIHWLASKGQVYYDHTGSVALRVVGINIDITNCKQIEAIARAKEEQADFLENGSIGLHWVGSDGQILWANQAELDLTGYSKEEYIGQSIAKFHADQEVIDDILRRLKAKETLHDYEARLVCKDGSIKYVSINSNVLWQDEQFIHTRCFTRDISERKQAEEKLQQSEEFLQRIIKSSPDCIKVLDLEGRLLYISTGGQALLEIDDLSSFINLEWVNFWQDTYNQTARNAVETAKAGGTGKFQGYCQTAKGTPKWWEVVVTPLLDTEGKPEKLLSVSRDISDRKQKEQALLESNQQIVNILESITDAFYAVDHQWRFTYLNQQAEQLLQRSREELLGKNIWDEFPEAVNLAFFEQYHQAVSQQVSVQFEEFYPPLNGWFKLHAYPSQDGLSVYFEDITERKRTEQEVQDLATALENAVEGISRLDTQGRYISVNKAYANAVGYQPEEMIGMEWPHTLHPEDRSKLMAAYGQMLIDGKVEIEARGIRKDGSIFYKQLVMISAYDEQKQFIGHHCFMKDISDRKLAEAQLQRQNKRSQLFADITLKIRQSLQIEEILQTTVTEVQEFLQADRVLIFRLWPNGYGQIVTEAVAPPWPSVINQNITDECFGSEYLQKYHQGRIYTIDDIEETKVQHCLMQFMQQFGVKAKLVMPVLLKEELWGLLVAHQCSSPRKWSTSEIELLQQLADQIGIALAQAQLLEQETRQRQELTRSNEELQQFASIASHDLQEPLRKIQAFGNRLKEKYSEELTEQGLDYLERMQNAAQRMQALIEDLLILSRITTKAQPFVAVNLAQITQEVLSDLEVRIQQTKGRVEVGKLPTLNTDPLQMRQLLQNLIGNALKFHRDEEPPIVKIDAQLFKDQQPIAEASSANICQITVEDNGIGFDEKYLDRIFNVFQRLQGRNQYEGTGMGLAICRKIVERHGGSITAESKLGRGTKFIVILPINNLALTET
jgi:PAS domain S-box-containing protein